MELGLSNPVSPVPVRQHLGSCLECGARVHQNDRQMGERPQQSICSDEGLGMRQVSVLFGELACLVTGTEAKGC